MNVGDILYFAPNVRFRDVDLDGPSLPSQYQQRILTFYIMPAERCADEGFAFASGTLLVSCTDALARARFGDDVEKRLTRFVKEELQSFSSGDLAKRFYLEFRNGLVHKARVKEGGQFSLSLESTVTELNGLLIVNPRLLARDVRASLAAYVVRITSIIAERERLAERLRREHAKDFAEP